MGRVDVDGMLAEMSCEQFDEWRAFDRIQPFGDEWRQVGKVCQILAAVNGATMEEESFMPIAKRPKTAEEIQAVMVVAATMQNGG